MPLSGTYIIPLILNIKTMTNYEIVCKLIGHIRPIGKSEYDIEARKNLEDYCDLVEDMIAGAISIGEDIRGFNQHSIKMIHSDIGKFLGRMAEFIEKYRAGG